MSKISGLTLGVVYQEAIHIGDDVVITFSSQESSGQLRVTVSCPREKRIQRVVIAERLGTHNPHLRNLSKKKVA